MNHRLLIICALALVLSACSHQDANDLPSSSKGSDERPNILLIVADDMGFTDLGVLGGEIPTPNIDQLAANGLLMTSFYNQAVCAHTRAALLSGTDNNNAGGRMHPAPNQRGIPGYEAELRGEIVSLPTLLQDAGYKTYMAGKWHLGIEPEFRPGARGFSRSLALLNGGASHWADQRGLRVNDRKMTYTLNDEQIEDLPADFYSTNDYTDAIIDFVDADRQSGKPWFAYLAYTAPHWPLQAPDDLIAKHAGKYSMGYETLRAQRIERAKTLGIIPASAQTYKRLDEVPAWNSLSAEEKIRSAKAMEVYAAMVESIDQNVGRLVAHLKANGQYENTFIMFISDNGADGGHHPSGDNGTDWTFDNSLQNMGKINSYIYYGPSWAQAGVGPFRYFKTIASEGGLRGGAVLHYPERGVIGQRSDAIATVVDIAPTALDLAGYQVPQSVNGRTVQDFQGRSMRPLLTGTSDQVHPDDTAFGWDVFGNYALRKGDWKLLRITSRSSHRAHRGKLEGTDYWGLYNLSADPGETNDVSAKHPEVMADLTAEWEAWIKKNGVVLPIVPDDTTQP